MGDKFKSKEYFDEYINRNDRGIRRYQEVLDNNDRPEDIKRIKRITNGQIGDKLKNIIAQYSRGDSISVLKPLMTDYLKQVMETDEPHESYNGVLNPLSFIILFNEPEEWKAAFRNQFFENAEKKMEVKDALLDFLTTGKKDDEGLIWNKYFKILWQAVIAESPEEQNKFLTEYVEQWYKSHKGEFWYNNYKTSSLEDVDKATYHGYWVWEAGAVAKLLNIPDDNLKEHPNYPYDLVHFVSRED